jgi:hypothetical protein
LVRHLEPDHIVPRNCVAEVLIRPGWLDLDDFQAALGFLNSHAEIAVLAPQENQHLADSNLKSKMPESWWDAPLGEKHALRFARYAAAKIAVTPWIGKMDLRSAQGPGCDDG